MIRTTRIGLLDMVAQNAAATSSRLRVLEEQAVTGLKVNRPSDAPSSLSAIHAMRGAAADQEVYQSTASSAEALLDYVEQTLSSVSDVLLRAREIATAMASETMSSEERAIAAAEVASLRDTLLDHANADWNGRYVFAGDAWDAEPFADDGTYQGASTAPETRVGADTWVQTGWVGSDVFAGDVDFFAVLSDLQTALEADDVEAVGDALDGLDQASTSLNLSRAKVGFEMNVASDALDVAESLEAAFAGRLDELVTADATQVYLDLAEVRATYEASLQVAASATGTSLFDYLS